MDRFTYRSLVTREVRRRAWTFLAPRKALPLQIPKKHACVISKGKKNNYSHPCRACPRPLSSYSHSLQLMLCAFPNPIYEWTHLLYSTLARAWSRKDGDNLLLTLKKKNFRGTISQKWAFKNCLSPFFHYFFPHPLPPPPPPQKKKNPFFRHIFWIYRK